MQRVYFRRRADNRRGGGGTLGHVGIFGVRLAIDRAHSANNAAVITPNKNPTISITGLPYFPPVYLCYRYRLSYLLLLYIVEREVGSVCKVR